MHTVFMVETSKFYLLQGDYTDTSWIMIYPPKKRIFVVYQPLVAWRSAQCHERRQGYGHFGSTGSCVNLCTGAVGIDQDHQNHEVGEIPPSLNELWMGYLHEVTWHF